ncbi:MAG: pacearchaeosortase [Candidatus Nanoarchaeia archaeon]|nr:pacearchaeosortase [Candidatus Nanoarchaeia archaeon]MDD5740883.1 pacearchaeosortase [Candidatus Nanoarchaeia archaeon]
MKKRRINKSRKDIKKPLFLLIRYIVLLGLMFTLPLIYKILTPLTVYSTGFLLKLFYQVSVSKDMIILPNILIQIIPACVAGSAYLLLLILNLTLPMKPKIRFYSLLFSIPVLFIVNVLRIFVLSVLLAENSQFFDFTHKIFWYILSTVFVIAIWFFTAYLFKIKEIPIYSDIKYLISNIKKRN